MPHTFDLLTDANQQRRKTTKPLFGQPSGVLTDPILPPIQPVAPGPAAGAGPLVDPNAGFTKGKLFTSIPGGVPGGGVTQPPVLPPGFQPPVFQPPGGAPPAPGPTPTPAPAPVSPAAPTPPTFTTGASVIEEAPPIQFAPLTPTPTSELLASGIAPTQIAPTQPGEDIIRQRTLEDLGLAGPVQPGPQIDTGISVGGQGDVITVGQELLRRQTEALGGPFTPTIPGGIQRPGIELLPTGVPAPMDPPIIVPTQPFDRFPKVTPPVTEPPVTEPPVTTPTIDIDAQAGGVTPGVQPGDTPPTQPAAPGGVTNDELLAASSERIFEQLTGKSIAADIALREGIDLSSRAAQTLGEARRSQLAASGLGGDGFEALLQRKDASLIMEGLTNLNREVMKQRVEDIQSGIINTNNIAATRSNLASAQIGQVLNLIPFMTESNANKAIDDIAMSTLGIPGFDPNSVDPTTMQNLSTFYQENLGMSKADADARAIGLIESEVLLTERGANLMLATLDSELGLVADAETQPKPDAEDLSGLVVNTTDSNFGIRDPKWDSVIAQLQDINDPLSRNFGDYSLLDDSGKTIAVEQGFIPIWNPETHLDTSGGDVWQYSNTPKQGSTVWFNGSTWEVGRRQLIEPSGQTGFSALTLKNVDSENQFITLDPRPDGSQSEFWSGTDTNLTWTNNPLPVHGNGKTIKSGNENEIVGSFDSNESDRLLGRIGLKFI